MGSSRNKMLNQQESMARANAQQAMTEAKQMTPAEQALYEQSQSFLNWEKSSGRDIREMPGIGAYLQIGEMAKRRAARERFGTGAMRLSGAGAEQYATKLREMYAQQSAQEFGAGLETAYAQRRAEALGSLMPLAQLGTQRSLGILNAAQQREGAYLNAPRETPFWKQLTLTAIQGASSAAGAYFGAKSDRRLKSNIKPSKYGLDEILQLESVHYIMDGQEQVGFIAQDIEQIMPEFVGEAHNGMKMVAYAHLTSVLAKAIQELHAELQESKKEKEKGRLRKTLSSFFAWLSRNI